jgi:hypothetical protein
LCFGSSSTNRSSHRSHECDADLHDRKSPLGAFSQAKKFLRISVALTNQLAEAGTIDGYEGHFCSGDERIDC